MWRLSVISECTQHSLAHDRWFCCGEHQIFGCAHHTPLLDTQHCITGQECKACFFYYSCKLRRARAPVTHHVLLQPRHCWKHTDQLPHWVIWKLLCRQPQNPAAHSKNTAREITGASLSSLLDLYNTHQACQAISIVCQSTHLSYNFSSPLPSGRRSWSLHDSSSRLRNSFIQQAVRILNSLSSLPAPHSQEDSHAHTHNSHFTLHKEYYCIGCTDTATSF